MPVRLWNQSLLQECWEVSIQGMIHLLTATVGAYCPPLVHNPETSPRRCTFSKTVAAVTVITTLSAFVKPAANAYVLNCFVIHILYSLGLELRRYIAVAGHFI